MAKWKHVALELFPEHSSEIETGDTIDLSWLLEKKLVEWLQQADYASAHRVVRYASWLIAHSRDEPHFLDMAMDALRSAVCREPIRSELWKAMSDSEFQALMPAFSGILKRDARKELEREFLFAMR